MKRVFIIHGWGGSPEKEIAQQWLVKELSKRKFEVTYPLMPNSETPKIKEWVSHLEEQVQNPDSETYFIGHSIGCQAILRYLERLPSQIKVGGVVLIAPWVNLLETAFEDPEEEKRIAEPWLKTSIDWTRVKAHTNNFTAIFSDDDYCVPLSDKDIFEEKLGTKTIIDHKMKHFSEADGIQKIPSALRALIKMS
jgi:predicted alpha/beta hydrolase family esterase